MSGPKVVRVRTREERAAECFALIDGLRVSIEFCETFARRHERLDSDAAQRRAALLAELVRQVEAGSFETVRRVCREEQAAVECEREQLERDMLERAASESNRRRRTQYLAQALVQRLEAQGRTVPRELEIAGNLSANDAETEDAERAVSKVLTEQMQEAGSNAPRAPSDTQRKLADALGSGSGIESLADWAARKAAATPGESGDRLERLIAEIDALDTTPAGNALLARAKAVRSESDASLRTRKIDSVLLEWAERRRGIKLESDLAIRARKVAIELARIHDERASALARHLDTVVHLRMPERAAAVAEAEAYLTAHVRDATATERRRAVLRGLASLGYEVGAELATVSPKGGRMVVRRPDRPGYGIELMAPEDAERMQVKVVAVGAGDVARDPARDRDAETAWCSEFSRLQELLRSSGTDLVIEKALPVGAAPLSRVSLSEDDGSNTELAERTRSRTT